MLTTPILYTARDALAFLVSILDSGLLLALTNIVSNGLTMVGSWLIPIGALVLIAYGFAILLGSVQHSVRGYAWTCVKLGVITAVLTASVYTQWVQTFSLTSITTDLGNFASAGATVGTDAHAFDIVANKAVVIGLAFWNSLSRFNPMKLLVVPFWAAAAVAVIFGFGVWLLGHILAVIYVCIGPIFVWMILVPPLRPAFSAWIGCLLSALMLQALAIILSTVVIVAEGQMVNSIATNLLLNGPAMVADIFAAALIYGLAAWVALKLPAIAATLFGGVHFTPSVLMLATYGALSNAFHEGRRRFQDHAVQAPGRVRSALNGPRPAVPPGPSLSRASAASAAFSTP